MSGNYRALMGFMIRGARTYSLAAVLLASSLPGERAFGQQPGPGSASQDAVPAVAAATTDAAPVAAPANYLNPDPAVRLQQLEETVARQQRQIQDLVSDKQSGGSPAGGAAQIPGADTVPYTPSETSIYPGGAAPPPPGSVSPGPYVIGSDRALFGSWTNDGPYFRSKNGDFTFHPRFVTQLDWTGMHSPPASIGVPSGGGTADSIAFRRLRVGADGTMWDTIDYVMEWDFAFALQNLDPSQGATPLSGLRSGGAATVVGGVLTPQNQAGNTTNMIQPTTVFLTFKEVPLLENIRIGNQQDWLSLEHIEGARFLDFMERSPLMDAFNGPNNNGYTPGISTFRTYFDQNLAIQMGAYRTNYYDSGATYNIGNPNYSYGGRIHCTPYYDEASSGRYLVHIGCGAEYRSFNTQPFANQDGTNVRLRSRGDIRTTASTLDPNFADTGNFYANGQGLVNPEFAINWGPWLIQGEYEVSYFSGAATQKGGAALGNLGLHGGYVECLYFLTGENRQYQRVSGVFGRTIPNSNAFFVKRAGFSKGAWQVGARYDFLSLNSGLVSGGQNQDMTLGVNWFLNPNTRFQFNYVGSWINNSVGATAAGTVFSLNGSKFTGEGYIQTVGGRMDFTF